ncbi:hypothetical protein J1N35_038735 [Gossypium stocksii]|uniref:Uncharacterized protein n=1 Tax=Gossypium stocksii TaxID=47602 RepID=A0A9D3UMA9_9ROSI|nr:hypothetical protein J1N35_038735 [Gossypium stocksii]
MRQSAQAWNRMSMENYCICKESVGILDDQEVYAPHTYVVASMLKCHLKLDSDMISNFILPMVKASPRILVQILIAHIHNEFDYTMSYHKAWLEKQKALENKYSGWEKSYNELWQWCQMLERYVPSSLTKLAYYGNRLVLGKDIFIIFRYCKPLVQIDGTFMSRRYVHRLFLTTAQNGNWKILSITFAIMLEESEDD